MNKKVLLTITLAFSGFIVLAQGKTVDQTVNYINSKASGNFKIEIIKEREMNIHFYKGGDNYRTDMFVLGTLDPSKTEYSTEETAIILRCFEDMPRDFKKFADACIGREFHNKGKLAYYNRSVISFEGDKKTQEGLVNAFNHLINIAQDEGEYKYIEEFE